MLTVQASAEGDEVRARISTVEPLDQAAAKLPTFMRIFMRDDKPMPSIAERLRERGDGEIALVLMIEGGQREVEVKLPGKYKATPQIAGAIKAVPGVVAVELA